MGALAGEDGPFDELHNHAMFGSVGAWFYQTLAGIGLDGDAGVGYRQTRIHPRIVEDLHSVSASVDTVRGRVSSSWTHEPGVVTLEVDIPVGTVAKVVVPKEEEMTEITVQEGDRVVWEKGHYVAGDPGVGGASQEKEHGEFVFDVGSGHYSFKLVGYPLPTRSLPAQSSTSNLSEGVL